MAQHVDPNLWRGTVRGRLLVAAGLFALWIAIILGRLYKVQILEHETWVARAKQQQTSQIDLPAPRGAILDRNGELLAYSVDEEALSGDSTLVKDPAGEVTKVCGALGDCTPQEVRELVAKFKPKKEGYIRIRRRIDQAQARRVRALDLKWTILERTPWRYYPNKQLAANLLGYVGLDASSRMDRGRAGLEGRWDRELRGQWGRQHVVLNEDRRPFLMTVGDPPVPGETLELTIDRYLQFVSEDALQAAVEKHDASGGCVVVAEPYSGEILALASFPTFNPNLYRNASPDQQRNRAVQDVYEPGSTFKIVTAAAALEQKVVRPDDIIDTGNGSIRIGNHTIEDTHAHGAIPFREVITKSSNIGAIKVGLRLGSRRLGQYVTALGFGSRLGNDFPGQEPGILHRPDSWTEVTLASVSFGYSISVTPLQITAAISAIANGGELVEPRVVGARIRGNTRTPTARRVIRRALQPETAAQLTQIMEGVTEEGGTASMLGIDGYTIAGKTGTARKIVGRGYGNSYRGSFVGFVPSRNPVVTIFVMLDAPRRGGYYGSVVAGPTFQRIAEAALRHLGVPPTINPPPAVLVERQAPRQVLPVAGPVHPLTIVPAGPLNQGQLLLPELRGMSGRAALLALSRLGLSARVTGDGVVSAQEPAAGTVVEPGASCRLWLTRVIPNPPPGTRP